VPLGHHLGAHENVDPAVFQVFQQIYDRPFPGHGILVHASHAGVREQLLHGFLYLFGANSQQPDFIGAAGRADRYGGLGKSAVVASEGIGPFMQGQGDVAVFAANGLAALCADGECGKSPSVEKDKGLVAIVQSVADGLLKRWRDVAANAPVIAALGKVNRLDCRQGLAVDPPGEGGGFIFSDSDIVPGLQRRSGRTQDCQGIVVTGPHNGQVPGIVAQAAFLLV
jgi:hypothetical protein